MTLNKIKNLKEINGVTDIVDNEFAEAWESMSS